MIRINWLYDFAALSEGCAFDSSRKTCAVRLLGLDRPEVVEPCAHRLLEVVACLAEGGVARGDKLLLLALELARRAGSGCRTQQFRIHGVDFAIEVGETGISADRLFDRAAGRRAIKARLAGKRHHRAPTLKLQCQPPEIVLRGHMIRIELEGGGEIGDRLGPVACLPIKLAASIEDIG